MTDRLKGLTVVLSTDVREDDAEAIIAAIRMVKGVLDVSPVVAGPEDWMNRRRIQSDLTKKLLEVLRDGE